MKKRGSNLPASEEVVRLQVYLAHCGVASRRACEKIILDGRVTVNGSVVTEMGVKVSSKDKICVDGKSVFLEKRKHYVLLNKPAGYVCSLSDEKIEVEKEFFAIKVRMHDFVEDAKERLGFIA